MTVVLGAVVANGTVVPKVWGDSLVVNSTITFSGTYKTGGDAGLAAILEELFKEIGRGSIDWVEVDGGVGYVFKWNYETNKLQLFRTGAAVKGVLEENPEEAYPAAITGAKLRLLAVGR